MPIDVSRFSFPSCFKQTVLATAIAVFSQQSFAFTDAGALQHELQKQIEREIPLPQVQPEKPVESKESDPEAQKIEVKGFKFEGNTLLSEQDLQERVNSWSGKELTFDELKEVTTAIQDLYASKSRIAQALLPPQDVSEGIIQIQIIEAKLGSVIMEAQDPEASLRVDPEDAKLFILAGVDASQMIDTRPFDRGIALINELPGVVAKGAFESGDQEGESNFRVKLSDSPLF